MWNHKSVSNLYTSPHYQQQEQTYNNIRRQMRKIWFCINCCFSRLRSSPFFSKTYKNHISNNYDEDRREKIIKFTHFLFILPNEQTRKTLIFLFFFLFVESESHPCLLLCGKCRYSCMRMLMMPQKLTSNNK